MFSTFDLGNSQEVGGIYSILMISSLSLLNCLPSKLNILEDSGLLSKINQYINVFISFLFFQ